MIAAFSSRSSIGTLTKMNPTPYRVRQGPPLCRTVRQHKTRLRIIGHAVRGGSHKEQVRVGRRVLHPGERPHHPRHVLQRVPPRNLYDNRIIGAGQGAFRQGLNPMHEGGVRPILTPE